MTDSNALPAVVSLITLGVRDLERSTDFYLALGWRLSSASVHGEVSFFHTGGALLSLYAATSLAADARVPAETVPAFRGASYAINVATVEQVDSGTAVAGEAGAKIVRAPEDTSWGGRISYFADPDGHLWEIAWNPGFPLGPEGLPTLPE